MARAPGFGVDIGGSGIKGCTVDLRDGSLADGRVRLPTPMPATPEAVAELVAAITSTFGWHGPMGVTLPGVLKRGIACTAAHLDPAWKGLAADELFSEYCRAPVIVLNDADAAGLAEMRFGAGRDHDGVVLLLTFGTGIGSALFIDGKLVPNTELGHLQVDGVDAETRAAAAARDNEALPWPDWAARVSRYLQVLEGLIWPDLIIAGGGVSKKADKWLPLLECRTTVVAAALRNDAGIVGAAAAAAQGRVR
ncbi:MAG: ROK family protein [Pseudonocardiales bacterium]|nr:ROK family protein [Pseudonocardiales bacterium]MBV9030024.1 ROK family protein [Pseudonocardiales bacterium]MBW0009756.1 ROK family protein [Pseudonocardiales bacterium]